MKPGRVVFVVGISQFHANRKEQKLLIIWNRGVLFSLCRGVDARLHLNPADVDYLIWRRLRVQTKLKLNNYPEIIDCVEYNEMKTPLSI